MDATRELPAEREAAEQLNGEESSTEDESESYQSLDEVVEPRDEEGNRLPEDVSVEELPKKVPTLLPNDDEEEILDRYFDEEEMVDESDLAELFNGVFPHFNNEVTTQSIEDMTRNTFTGHLVAILKRAEYPQVQIDLARNEITDHVVDQAEKMARIENAGQPGNR